jgi:hypothetical protein
MPLTFQDLIRYIVWYATQRDMRLTTIRLVKFLYLADLYYARVNNGRTLTAFPWAFIYYGPYCSAAMQAIESAVDLGFISKQTYDSKYPDANDYSIFTSWDSEAEQIESNLPPSVRSSLQTAINKFGDDTAALLDYVYFSTEPMIGNVKKGDKLDFSSATPMHPSPPVKPKPLDKEKLAIARRCLDNIHRSFQEDQKRLNDEIVGTRDLLDDAFYQALDFLDGEDVEPGLRGTARIIVE